VIDDQHAKTIADMDAEIRRIRRWLSPALVLGWAIVPLVIAGTHVAPRDIALMVALPVLASATTLHLALGHLRRRR
jgi:hypothetical protein